MSQSCLVLKAEAKRNGMDVLLTGHRDPEGVIHILERPVRRDPTYGRSEPTPTLVHRIETGSGFSSVAVILGENCMTRLAEAEDRNITGDLCKKLQLV